VARGTTRVDFDTEALVDFLAGFFSGLPTAGDATNAPAARQLIKTKGLIFISFPPLLMFHLKRCPQKGSGGRREGIAKTSTFGLARFTSVSWPDSVADAL